MISKKDKIIEAACATLIREGSNFSMRKVADELSMSLGNLQYHFKTKSDLIQGMMKRYIDLYRREFEKFIQNSNKGKEGVKKFIRMILVDEANDNGDQFFIALYSFADQKGMEIPLQYFYRETFSILGEFLEIIADFPCSSGAIHRASSLLLPYIEGYGTVGSHVEIDHGEMAGILTDMVWSLLLEESR
jgi:AcrR family transcriptional regulator